MYCEICGREISKGGVAVRIEGTLMKTCIQCSRHGERIQLPITHRAVPQRSKPVSMRKKKALEVVDEYSSLIRKNRETMGLTQDQLGSKINEKGSVISRLESGHMEPDIKTARKLERFFSIKLLQEEGGD